MQIPPATSYAQRAGASIAYQVFGEDPPVVMVPTAPLDDVATVEEGADDLERCRNSIISFERSEALPG